MKKTVGSLSLTALTAAAMLAAMPASAVSVKVESFQKADSPWDMAFLPDGTMFFTEKCGGLSVRTSSGGVNKLLGLAVAAATARPRMTCSAMARLVCSVLRLTRTSRQTATSI